MKAQLRLPITILLKDPFYAHRNDTEKQTEREAWMLFMFPEAAPGCDRGDDASEQLLKHQYNDACGIDWS